MLRWTLSSWPTSSDHVAVVDSITLPTDMTAPQVSRAWLETRLDEFGLHAERHCDVILAADELVTNVVEHTASAPVLSLSTFPGGLRIEVTDRSPTRAQAREVADAQGGWGLRIVGEVAEEWGATHHAGGKVVWFTVTL